MKYFFRGIFIGIIILVLLNREAVLNISRELTTDVYSNNLSTAFENEFVFANKVSEYSYDNEKFIKKNFLRKDELYHSNLEPYSIQDFEKFLVTLAFFAIDEEKIFYPLTFEDFEKGEVIDNFTKAQTIVVEKYPELFTQFRVYDAEYFSDDISQDETFFKIIMRTEENETTSDNIYKQLSVINKSFEILKNLERTNQINTSMSQEEIAKVIYTYIAVNSSYDTTLKKYTGYDLLFNNSAVCQGYTAVYNMMLKMVGIDVVGKTGKAQNELHIWSYVNMDNRWFYSDATFGDPIPDKEGKTNYKFFKMTKEEISKTHTFDNE